ncbi:unnamed protein product [Rotaria magnacalcarata]|uniref:TIR domain-containing protein n=3 Tax=Rotaria magnacalcarata TaxID=392030 RepID=A0A815V1C0_9BILA|nr:unnamed protein product [Rotaria magnacalcarata]
MGCAASFNALAHEKINSNEVIAITSPTIQQQELMKYKQSTPNMSSGARCEPNFKLYILVIIILICLVTINVLISCHHNEKDVAEQLSKQLTNLNFTCYTLTDATPSSIVARANLVRWSDVFISLISRSYQRTFFCMETISYAKYNFKPIVAILAESNFQPYGALGVISAGAVHTMLLHDNDISEDLLAQLSNTISNQKINENNKNVTDPAKMEANNDKVNMIHGETQCTILVCTVDDGVTIAQLVYEDFISNNLNVGFENLSKPNAACSVRRCNVLVPILTARFEQTPICRGALEEARQLKKPIVPVIAIKDWRSDDWLGLTIAGCEVFRIFDNDSAYEAFLDSSRMTDLRVDVEIRCRPVPSRAEREKAEIKTLKEKIEECKSKLQTWPPAHKLRTLSILTDRQAVRVTLVEPSTKPDFTYIHQTVSRLDIKAPASMLDEYGFSKRREVDCMISYQWDNHKFVRQIYEDMTMREIRVWFDIWGSMQGNANETMATGVECAKVLLVFLSKAYIESPYCRMEFRYAVKRGKAFVVLRTEPNIQLDQWMLDAIQGFPEYEVYSYNALETLINGVSTIDVIMHAVRHVGHAQPRYLVDDCSAELFWLRCLFDDALDAISVESGQSRFKTCTRCGQQFEEHTNGGCKSHPAHFMDGTILESRWVCCQQQGKRAPGCNPCDHTDVARVFTQDPSVGTWTWVPT